MDFSIPNTGEALGTERVQFLQSFTKSCRATMLGMLKTSQSGHPGGSLSALDILAVLYAFRITQTNEKIVVSNGHISPGVFSVLAECGAVDKEQVIKEFRQLGSKFEGHVTRHVEGVHFGTGPLGVGVSAAAGFALAAKRKQLESVQENPSALSGSSLSKREREKVWCVMGDGEAQEGQVHEMALFAAQEKLNNLVVFVDYNQVQLTASLKDTLNIDVSAFFGSAGWQVIEIDGHDQEAIWATIQEVENADRPVVVVAKTVMGQGVSIMQEDGENLIPTWHGKSPKIEELDEELKLHQLNGEQEAALESFRKERNFKPEKNIFRPTGDPMPEVNVGKPILYAADEMTDCRSAYGKALLDLAKHNKQVWASTADLGGSVMTKFVKAELPEQFVEFGIAEQNMVSVAGGASFDGIIPFTSTFGAFLSSRAKDQARVNDINQANVKMVATHCGLSVGEDGPTHQAIDDMGSFLGFFNMHVMEPADPNHCDRIIRFIASHYGNYYVRMGRHKLPVLTREDGSILFNENYQYEYGKTEVLRSGSAVTIVATGATVIEALRARENSGVDAEIVIASSIKKFDHKLKESIQKTGKVITVEDHNVQSGLGAAVSLFITQEGLQVQSVKNLGVSQYALSGKPAELYAEAGIDAVGIEKALKLI